MQIQQILGRIINVFFSYFIPVDQGSLSSTLFEQTFCAVTKSGLRVFCYAADIRNIECLCEQMCGKYKVGYLVCEEETPPAHHISRLTQTCPSLDLYWACFELRDEFMSQSKKIGLEWERDLHTQFSRYNIKGREIFKSICTQFISSQ